MTVETIIQCLMAHPFVAARRQVAVQGKNVSQRVRPGTKSGYRYGLGASTSPLARRRINLKHAETTRFATCKRPTNRLPRPKSEKRAVSDPVGPAAQDCNPEF